MIYYYCKILPDLSSERMRASIVDSKLGRSSDTGLLDIYSEADRPGNTTADNVTV